MTKFEALIEFIKKKIHPDIADGFSKRYQGNSEHIIYDHAGYIFYIYDEEQHQKELEGFLSEELDEIEYALLRTEFRDIVECIDRNMYTFKKLQDSNLLLSDYDPDLSFESQIGDFYIYKYE